MIVVLQLFCPFNWIHVLIQEWKCSCSSTDRWLILDVIEVGRYLRFFRQQDVRWIYQNYGQINQFIVICFNVAAFKFDDAYVDVKLFVAGFVCCQDLRLHISHNLTQQDGSNHSSKSNRLWASWQLGSANSAIARLREVTHEVPLMR